MADAKACESISRYLKGNIKKFLEKQNGRTGEQFASERYARFRKFSKITEAMCTESTNRFVTGQRKEEYYEGKNNRNGKLPSEASRDK